MAIKFGWAEVVAGKLPGVSVAQLNFTQGQKGAYLHIRNVLMSSGVMGWGAKVPNQGPDNRPMYYVELAKTGDTWLRCKEGALALQQN